MRPLPIIKLGRQHYYVDDRLQEIRNCKNPNDREEMEASTEWYINNFGVD